MSLTMLLLIILVVALVAGYPSGLYASRPYLGGGLGLVLLILLILVLADKL